MKTFPVLIFIFLLFWLFSGTASALTFRVQEGLERGDAAWQELLQLLELDINTAFKTNDLAALKQLHSALSETASASLTDPAPYLLLLRLDRAIITLEIQNRGCFQRVFYKDAQAKWKRAAQIAAQVQDIVTAQLAELERTVRMSCCPMVSED
jgi:hypothetical protein